MDPETMTGTFGNRTGPGRRYRTARRDYPQKELPQAQPPPAFGLSISKPCFSMVSV